MRYWLSPRVGLEAGGGSGYGASSSSQTQYTTTTTTSSPARGSLGATLGLPVALAWSRSLVRSIVPYVSYAEAFQPGGDNPRSYDNTAVVRVGTPLEAAVHLGSLGLPQVALEARFGVQAQVAIETSETGVIGESYPHSQTVSYRFGTTIGEFSLEHVLTSSFAATYYF